MQTGRAFPGLTNCPPSMRRLLLALLIASPAVALAQAPPDSASGGGTATELGALLGTAEVATADARDALAALTDAPDGLTPVHTADDGSSLYASVVAGVVVDYVGVGASGAIFGLRPVTTENGAAWACAASETRAVCWHVGDHAGEGDAGEGDAGEG